MLVAPLAQDTSFQSTWQTEQSGSPTKTIVIPTSSTGTYGVQVDWGDGTTSTMSTYNDSAWTHVYGSTGTYTIKIYGTFVGLVFNNGGDRFKLFNIIKWGPNFRLGTNQTAYFSGCSNLTSPTPFDGLVMNGTTTLMNAFVNCSSLTSITGMNSWIMSGVTAMNSMFSGATVFNQYLGNWDVSKVTNFTNLFRNTTYNQSLVTWNVVSATTLNGIFSRSSSAAGANPDITGWNTANVNSFQAIAQNNTSFNQTSISAFNTANVTNMNNTFNGATSANPDVSSWNIGNLTNAASMFTNSAFDITNYNKLLDSVTGWPSQGTIQNGVTFSAGTAHYSGANAIAGRAVLATTHSWTITDGGTP